MSEYLDYRSVLIGDYIVIGNSDTIALYNNGDVILDISSGLAYLQYIEQGSIEWRQWTDPASDGSGSYIIVYSFPSGDYFAIHNSEDPLKDFIQYFKGGIETMSASYDRPIDGSLVKFNFSTTLNGITVDDVALELDYSVGSSAIGIDFSNIDGNYSSMAIDCKLDGIMRNIKLKKEVNDFLSYPLDKVLTYVDESIRNEFGEILGNPSFVYGDFR